MEYDCDTLIGSSSTSSSLSSTDNYLNYFKMPTASVPAAAVSNKTINSTAGLSSQQQAESNYVMNATNAMNPSSTSTMPNSCSLIFSTAASFNINQNDAVFYARESIHLLAKFLATHGENGIFRSLYSFAPDNLAWFWAFFDWETPIELSQVPVQDVYKPFNDTADAVAASWPADLDLHKINKILADSPLIQYKYRENLMIGDLFKFIEHVHKTNVTVVAKALFVLYFPRFAMFIDNPLKKLINPKILSSNVSLVKELDSMITRLIKTRYSNLDEYKEKILSASNLPSYVRSLLSENGFWCTNVSSANRLLIHTLTSGLKANPFVCHNKTDQSLNNKPLISNRTSPANSNCLNSNNNELIDEKYLLPTTLNYFKFLEKNKINIDLDHVSFDNNNNNLQQQPARNMVPYEVTDLDDQEEELANILLNKNDPRKLTKGGYMSGLGSPKSRESVNMSRMDHNLIDNNNYFINIGASNNNPDLTGQLTAYRNAVAAAAAANNLRLASPVLSSASSTSIPISNQSQQLSQIIQNNANKLLMNTPQTPSTLNPYMIDINNNSAKLNDQHTIWGASNPRFCINNNNRNSFCSTVTPPPSATLQKSNQLAINDINFDDAFNLISSANLDASPFDQLLLGDDSINKYLKQQQQQQHQQQYLSPPLARQVKANDFKRFTGEDYFNPTSAENMLNSCIGNFSNLNINTNLNGGANLINAIKSPQLTPIGSASASKASPVYGKNIISSSTQHIWCGRLPPKIYQLNSIYSRKVFLGGLPWDVNQPLLTQMLQKYGTVKIEIPGKDLKHPRVSNICKSQERSTPGYVYIIFDHEAAVQRLLADCRKEFKNGGEHYYYNIFIPSNNFMGNHQSNAATAVGYVGYGHHNMNKRTAGKSKEVEVIPWNQEDTSYVPQNKNSVLPSKIDARSTIFVGALHGMLNAHGLGKVMSEIFGDVIHAGLDTDKYKYPIGSGRVTFRDRQSYIKAIKAKYVTIKANMDPTDPSPKFEKTIQIDPYLEDAKCSKCDTKAQLFCRNETCLDYFCQSCWYYRHDLKVNGEHIPLSRQNKPNHG